MKSFRGSPIPIWSCRTFGSIVSRTGPRNPESSSLRRFQHWRSLRHPRLKKIVSVSPSPVLFGGDRFNGEEVDLKYARLGLDLDIFRPGHIILLNPTANRQALDRSDDLAAVL